MNPKRACSRRSGFGAHQFQSPSSPISAGTSSARTIVVSMITAAAVLFCVAIGAFSTSQIIFIKELGLGTALAVLIDATIVRALLVPALMELLGRWNWWAPRPLRRLHERFGLSEHGAAPA